MKGIATAFSNAISVVIFAMIFFQVTQPLSVMEQRTLSNNDIHFPLLPNNFLLSQLLETRVKQDIKSPYVLCLLDKKACLLHIAAATFDNVVRYRLTQ